jgi:hypothetical protein
MAHVCHEFALRSIRRFRAFLGLVQLAAGQLERLQHAVDPHAQTGYFVPPFLGDTLGEVAAGANGGHAGAQPDDTRLHHRFHQEHRHETEHESGDEQPLQEME